MEKTQYGKFIVTELQQVDEAPWTNPPPAAEKGTGGRVLFLDSSVIPGAFYVEVALGDGRKNQGKEPRSVAEPHTHEWDEVFGIFGTDLDDPHALTGEVEFWLGGEKHIITKSCLIYVPAGLEHCPLIYRNVTKPILTFTTHQGKAYY